MHRLHPSRTARLAIYALFAFSLGIQAFFAPTKGPAVEAIVLFTLAVSVTLALAAVYVALSTHAPLTATPPPTGATAAAAFVVATWSAPILYLVFYSALLALSLLVALPLRVFHLSDVWLALLVLVSLGGCFFLEFLFLSLLRVTADSLPAPLALPPDQ